MGRIRDGHLCDEEWWERKAYLAAVPDRTLPQTFLGLPPVNINRFYNRILAAINHVFHGERRETKPDRVHEQFFLADLKRPKLEELFTALETGNEEMSDRLIAKIGAGGRKAYLQTTNQKDVRAMFSYLARTEGRKTGGFNPADSAPLMDAQGRAFLTPPDNVRVITKTFRRRFSAPAVLDPQHPRDSSNNVPLLPF